MIELYLALCRALKEASGVNVKHIDRWNQNVEFIDQDAPWPRPAVFVEFGAVTWEPYKGPRGGQTGKGTFSLHLITEWAGPAPEGCGAPDPAFDDLAFAVAVEQAVEGLQGKSFRNIRLLESRPNNNHEEIIETVDVYAVTFERIFGDE